MLATEEIINLYQKELNADYTGEYLNRSEHLLESGYDYSKVEVSLKPLRKGTIKDVDFNGRVHFTEIAKSQYGAPVEKTKLMFLDFMEAKTSDFNFGGPKLEKKLIPYCDGPHETSGHNHPYYREISMELEQAMIDDTSMSGKIWWSLLKDRDNSFSPTDFGLAVLVIDTSVDLYIRYNSFQWQTTLNWDSDLEKMHKTTVSKKICKKEKTT